MSFDIDAAVSKWTNILNTLLKDYTFEDFLVPRSNQAFNNWFWGDGDDTGLGRESERDLSIKFLHGMTRLVIRDKSCDYVIKILFNPGYETKYMYDYNAMEAEVYKQACEHNLDCFFVPMRKLFDFTFSYKDKEYICPIYAMDFCETDDEQNSEMSQNFQYDIFCEQNNCDATDPKTWEKFDEACEDFGEEDQMFELAEHLWGTDLKELIDFLEEREVNDLHSGNWGFIDDRFVICDYGGFCNYVCGIRPTLNPAYTQYINSLNKREKGIEGV